MREQQQATISCRVTLTEQQSRVCVLRFTSRPRPHTVRHCLHAILNAMYFILLSNVMLQQAAILS